jgi:protein-disulfide isomerase
MTNPTPLSPAAQAVIYAYSKVAYDKDIELSFLPLHWECRAAAAALRAAADQLGEEMIVMGEGFKGVTRDELSIIHVEDLLDIAAELDGSTTTSENV